MSEEYISNRKQGELDKLPLREKFEDYMQVAEHLKLPKAMAIAALRLEIADPKAIWVPEAAPGVSE